MDCVRPILIRCAYKFIGNEMKIIEITGPNTLAAL